MILLLPSSILAWDGNLNPAAFWELEQTSATYADSTGNGHGFTAAPSAPARAGGVIDFGQQFDGTNDYLELAVAEELDMCGMNKFIISFWLYVDSTTADRERIISWSGGSGTQEYLAWVQIGSATDKLYFGGTNNAGSDIEVSTPSDVPIGEWTLITAEWYQPFVGPSWAPSLNIWMNGVQEVSTTWPSGTNWALADCDPAGSNICTGTGCQLNLGRKNVGGMWFYDFAGRIDELGIWENVGSDTASSSQTIHEQMLNTGPGKKYTNLADDTTQNTALLTDAIAHYDLDEVSVPYSNSVDAATHSLTQSVASQRPAQATGLISFGQDFERATLDQVYATNAIWDATGDGWAHQQWVNLQTEPALGGTCGGAWGGTGVNTIICPQAGDTWESQIASTPTTDLALSGGDSSIGSWTHLLTTFQGTGTGLAYFYVDGKIMDSGIRTDATTVPSATYWLGKNGASASNYNLDGTLDEVALWQGRALNVEEIIELYNSGAGAAYSTWGGSPGPSGSSNVSLNVGCPANVDCSLTYDPLTSIFNYTINDSEQTVSNISLEVTYINGSSLGYQTFSTNSTANYTGTVLIDASTISPNNWTMRGFGYITDYNRTFISGSPTILTNHIWVYGSSLLDPLNFDIDGNPEGLFWAAMLIGTLMLFGAWNPPVAVTLGAVGVVLSAWLGLLNVSTTTLWTITIAAIVVAWGML